MQQISNMQTVKKKNSIIVLFISWLIILGIYLSLRIFFLAFGFHSYSAMLGACLAVVPYLLSAFYLYKTPISRKIWFYLLGILLPSIVEKTILYYMGALLYGINPANIDDVLRKITLNEPYTNCFTNPAARYVFNLSFFGWPYIIGSTGVCIILILCLVFAGKRKK